MSEPAPPQPPAEPTPDPTPSPWAAPPAPEPWTPPTAASWQPPAATPTGYEPDSAWSAPTPPDRPPSGAYPTGYPPPPGYPPADPGLPGYPVSHPPYSADHPSAGQPPYSADHPSAGQPPGWVPTPGWAPAPPPWEPTPPPVPGRVNTGLVAVGVVLAVLLCGGAGVAIAGLVNWRESNRPVAAPTPPSSGEAGGPALPAPTEPEPTVRTGRQVVYQVSGDGPAEVSYLEYPNMPRQLGATSLPWRVEFAMPDPGVVTVLAIRTATGAGQITCTILVDGEEVITNSASGPYATAACAGLTID